MFSDFSISVPEIYVQLSSMSDMFVHFADLCFGLYIDNVVIKIHFTFLRRLHTFTFDLLYPIHTLSFQTSYNLHK